MLLAASTAILGAGAARAEYSDCRSCHYATTIDGTAPDLTGYFLAPGHHPVRVSYPVRADYNQPAGAATGILFFDLNGNGVPDPDEIQLFSSTALTPATETTTTTRTRGRVKSTAGTDTWMIDCASCHIEHGIAPPDPVHSADYVRRAGGERLLCVTCHNL